MEGKIAFGIVGAGAISKFHIDAVNANAGEAFVAGITDLSKETALRVARQNGGIRVYDSVENLLADESIHAVCICVPNGFHAEIIQKAAARKKHIVVEKPLAITKRQLYDAEQAVEENGVTLAVISQLRFAPGIRQAKAIIHSGALGKIAFADMYMKYNRLPEYYASGAWRGTKKLDGGGALMNQGVHGVDLLQTLAGDVRSVFAFSRTISHQIEVEDALSASLEFENGAIGVLQASTCVYPGYPRRIEINGDKGSLTVTETALTRLDLARDNEDFAKNVRLADFESGAAEAMDISGDYHALQITDFIAALKEGRKPLVDFKEGRKAVDVILAMYASAREGRRVFIEELNPRPQKAFC